MRWNKLISLLVMLLMVSPIFGAGKVVVYNWTEYIPDAVLKQFTDETGIKVEYSTFENNEVMVAKLQLQKGKGYDIVVPSTYLITKMRAEGLIQPLDKKKLRNFKHLDPVLLNKSFDPNNTYSIPYLWGSTAIGVNKLEIDPSTIQSWRDLWNPKYKGQVMLIDDVREVFSLGLKLNGYSTNSTNPKEIETAYKTLKKLMSNVLLFNADAPREPFLAGDVKLGMLWNGEASMAQMEDKNIVYVYPKEGVDLWVDNFVIPSGAENVDNAHKFINFMLRPEIAKVVVNEIGYSTPNKTARTLLEDSIKNNPVIFPPNDVLKKAEFQSDVGEALKTYHKYWEMLKTGK